MTVFLVKHVVESIVEARSAEDAIHSIKVDADSRPFLYNNTEIKRHPRITAIEAKENSERL